MTTIRNIIRKSCRLCGVVSANEDISSEDLDLGKETLSSLLDSWSVSPKFHWESTKIDFPINSSTEFVTFAQRPVRVLDVVYKIDTIAYILKQIDRRDFMRTSVPSRSFPSGWSWNGGLVLDLIGRGEGTLSCLVQNPLVDLTADIDAEFSMPPGYSNAVTYSLAMMLSEEYGRMPSASLVAFAESSVDLLPSANFRPNRIRTDVAGIFGQRNVMVPPWTRE